MLGIKYTITSCHIILLGGVLSWKGLLEKGLLESSFISTYQYNGIHMLRNLKSGVDLTMNLVILHTSPNITTKSSADPPFHGWRSNTATFRMHHWLKRGKGAWVIDHEGYVTLFVIVKDCIGNIWVRHFHKSRQIKEHFHDSRQINSDFHASRKTLCHESRKIKLPNNESGTIKWAGHGQPLPVLSVFSVKRFLAYIL